MTDKNYLPNIVKEDYGDWMIRKLLQKHPELSLVQVRRIFSNTYSRLNSKGAKSIYEKQKKFSTY